MSYIFDHLFNFGKFSCIIICPVDIHLTQKLELLMNMILLYLRTLPNIGVVINVLLSIFQVKYLVNKAKIWRPKKAKDEIVKGM